MSLDVDDPLHHLCVLAFCVASLSVVALLLALRMRPPAGWTDEGYDQDEEE